MEGAPAGYGLRWVMLRTFPIKLIYAVRDDALLLVAVFHARRRPGYWLERLKQLVPRHRGFDRLRA